MMVMMRAVAALGVLATLASAKPAQAVPSFARQTGQPCGACHTDFPQLTPFGRSFKLRGYTAGGGPFRRTPFDDAAAAAVLAELQASPLRLEHPLIETELLRRRRATIVVDADVHPRVDRRTARLMGWRSYAAAPVVVGAQALSHRVAPATTCHTRVRIPGL